MKRFRRFLSDRGGAAALEFALIGLPLILLMFGLIEFGRGLHIRNALDAAADRAQRVIIIDPDASEESIELEIQNTFVAGQLDRLDISHGSVSVSGIDHRSVTLNYQMNLILPAPLGGTIGIEATRRVALNN